MAVGISLNLLEKDETAVAWPPRELLQRTKEDKVD